jgi:hypothetical protein
VSYSITHTKLYDSHITNLVISNKRDNTLALSSVYLSIGEQGRFELIKFDEPLLLKAFDTKLVDVPKYSNLINRHGPVKINLLDRLSFHAVTMSGDEVQCYTESPVMTNISDLRIRKFTSKFRGIILTNKMGFIFSYFKDGERIDVIIDKHGFISENSPFEFNCIPDITPESFRDAIINGRYYLIFTKYELFKVQNDLSTEKILTHAQVNDYMKNKNEDTISSS